MKNYVKVEWPVTPAMAEMLAIGIREAVLAKDRSDLYTRSTKESLIVGGWFAREWIEAQKNLSFFGSIPVIEQED